MGRDPRESGGQIIGMSESAPRLGRTRFQMEPQPADVSFPGE
jgi:hypothetical protein